MDADSGGDEGRAGEETFKDKTRQTRTARKQNCASKMEMTHLGSTLVPQRKNGAVITSFCIRLGWLKKNKSCTLRKQLGEQMPEPRVLNANDKATFCE